MHDFKWTTELPFSKYPDGLGYSFAAKVGKYDAIAEKAGKDADNEIIRHWRYSADLHGSPFRDEPKPQVRL